MFKFDTRAEVTAKKWARAESLIFSLKGKMASCTRLVRNSICIRFCTCTSTTIDVERSSVLSDLGSCASADSKLARCGRILVWRCFHFSIRYDAGVSEAPIADAPWTLVKA